MTYTFKFFKIIKLDTKTIPIFKMGWREYLFHYHCFLLTVIITALIVALQGNVLLSYLSLARFLIS